MDNDKDSPSVRPMQVARLERRFRLAGPVASLIAELAIGVAARLAVRPWQIRDRNLPTRPTKITDSRAKGFGDISVELDAIDPSRLRRLVEQALAEHIPPDALEALLVAEKDEKQLLLGLVGMVADAADE
jgi:hypothetical protein